MSIPAGGAPVPAAPWFGESAVPSSIDRGYALLGLAVVVAANVRYLAGLADVIDPVLSMEPYYIAMARRPLAAIIAQDPAWGSLYALWLKPFRALFADPLAVHAANVRVLSIAVCCLLYFYTILLTRRAVLATIVALVFLVSDFNVPLSSKVCSFALLVVVAGLAISELFARRAPRRAVVAVGVLLASYARPELYPAGILLWLFALWSARTDARPAPPGRLAWAVVGTASIAAVAIGIGTPVWSLQHDNGRLFVAFREHFAWNWGHWHGGWQYYLAVWEREFGDASSLAQAIANNPAAVARHLLDNAAGVLRLLATASFEHYPVLLPGSWAAARLLENLGLAVAAVAIMTWAVARGDRRRLVVDCCGRLGLPLAAIAVFSFGSAVLIYPERHYLVVPVVLAMPLLVAVAAATLPLSLVLTRRQSVVVALACVIGTPTPFVVQAGQGGPMGSFTGEIALIRQVTDTVHRIRSLGLDPPVRVLTFTDGIGELLGDGYEEIKVWRMGDRSMRDYVREERVDVIVTMERGRKSFLIDDPYWTLVETNPKAAGFVRVPTSDRMLARIYVRSDLVTEDE